MPKLKVISGKKLVSEFGKFGFVVISQKGSHIKMVRLRNSTQTIVVPNHKTIAKGTLKEIYVQAKKYIPEEDLKRIFYS